MKNNWLVKLYWNLPLWGKVAVPAAGVLLIISAFSMFKTALWLGVLAVIAYFGIRAYTFFNKKKE